MFDQIFTAQAFLIRCHQATYLMPWWMTLASALSSVGYIFFSFTGGLTFLRQVGTTVIAPILGLISYVLFFYIIFVMAYTAFNCGVGPWWIELTQ
jgi:hypothetical protein